MSTFTDIRGWRAGLAGHLRSRQVAMPCRCLLLGALIVTPTRAPAQLDSALTAYIETHYVAPDTGGIVDATEVGRFRAIGGMHITTFLDPSGFHAAFDDGLHVVTCTSGGCETRPIEQDGDEVEWAREAARVTLREWYEYYAPFLTYRSVFASSSLRCASWMLDRYPIAPAAFDPATVYQVNRLYGEGFACQADSGFFSLPWNVSLHGYGAPESTLWDVFEFDGLHYVLMRVIEHAGEQSTYEVYLVIGSRAHHVGSLVVWAI